MDRSVLNARWIILLGWALLLGPGISGAETINERFNALIEIDENAAGRMTTRERGIRVAAAYDAHFGDYAEQDFSEMASEDLVLYLRATELVLVMSLRTKDLGRMELAFEQLRMRGKSNKFSAGMMYRAYILSRRFEKARALAKLHDLDIGQTQPTYTSLVTPDYRGRSLLEASGSGSKLSRVPFNLPKDGYIVVVSHPMCHFSRRAMAAIEEDEQLRALFGRNVTWLAPVDGLLNFDAVQSWNATYPRYHVSIAFSREDWPEIDYWGTPTFYFFGKDGLSEKIVGWPEEGRRADLLDAARSVGIGSHDTALPSTKALFPVPDPPGQR